MKYFILIILLALNPVSDLDKIATINKHKKQAREAYNNGEYEKALSHYTFLVDSMKVDEPEVLLNYGNTLYQLNDTTRAIERFASLYETNDKEVRSVANQQLGVIHNKMLKEPKAALEYFKQALKDDPTNEDARYNYEMLKKALKEQEQQQDQQDQQDQNKEQQQDQKEQEDQEQQQQDQQNDQQQKDQQEQQDKEQQSDQKKEGEEGEQNEDQEQKDQEQSEEESGEEKEQKDQQQQEGEPDEQDDQQNEDLQNSVAEKLKDMKISEEKARMILEAMKNNEIQYFQQNKRKPTKKKDSSKPDW